MGRAGNHLAGLCGSNAFTGLFASVGHFISIYSLLQFQKLDYIKIYQYYNLRHPNLSDSECSRIECAVHFPQMWSMWEGSRIELSSEQWHLYLTGAWQMWKYTEETRREVEMDPQINKQEHRTSQTERKILFIYCGCLVICKCLMQHQPCNDTQTSISRLIR